MVEKQLESANLKISQTARRSSATPSAWCLPRALTWSTHRSRPGRAARSSTLADVNVASVTATVLNTYFETDAFTPGLNLGRLTADIETVRYPRPSGASPFNVPLVPAFAPCTAPDVSHISPLDAARAARRRCRPRSSRPRAPAWGAVTRGCGQFPVTRSPRRTRPTWRSTSRQPTSGRAAMAPTTSVAWLWCPRFGRRTGQVEERRDARGPWRTSRSA